MKNGIKGHKYRSHQQAGIPVIEKSREVVMIAQSTSSHERSCCREEAPEKNPTTPRNSWVVLSWHQIGTILVMMLVLALLFFVL